MNTQQNGQGAKQSTGGKELPGSAGKEAGIEPTPHPDTVKDPEKMDQSPSDQDQNKDKENETSKTTK